ncbi:uncharacterized protein Z520_10071 [Fonsecaea multimorphosa CBS 102226]|uniref:Uncharacterized protein n=1 Tax=Fonsecaea multimorphosa CBS 102226 TaxID=1442371 RepID=A0A0D2IB32_9EURO|nr:uncharacterized protein Z520_10071 [Fonsecaea multimorphosa CBS 102226]KIX94361.1 hypothetical protein Z520_10071 [Fonsecaea multimorphosa CBS 102226]
MTGSGPGRGTEILTVRHRNDSTGKGRGIFIDSRLVDIVVGYYKGYGFSVKSKIVHRFLPREPFVEILQMYHNGQKDFEAWLWEPRGRDKVNTDEDNDDFDDEGPECESEPLVDEAGDDEFERDMNPTVEEQLPKPASTNIDSFWDTNRVRYTLERATE